MRLSFFTCSFIHRYGLNDSCLRLRAFEVKYSIVGMGLVLLSLKKLRY